MHDCTGRTWLEHAVEIDQSDEADEGVGMIGLMLVLRLKTAQTSFGNTRGRDMCQGVLGLARRPRTSTNLVKRSAKDHDMGLKNIRV